MVIRQLAKRTCFILTPPGTEPYFAMIVLKKRAGCYQGIRVVEQLATLQSKHTRRSGCEEETAIMTSQQIPYIFIEGGLARRSPTGKANSVEVKGFLSRSVHRTSERFPWASFADRCPLLSRLYGRTA